MATTYWNPNAINTAQVDTLTIGGAPVAGNTVSGVINTKSVTYTVVGGDTTSTVATALQALLQASTTPPEFNEMTWSVSGPVITATSNQPGRPFTLTAAATGGGATNTHAVVTANSSMSDVGNANNWLRSGSASLPQNSDDVVVADSSVPLLWNLHALSAVTLNSYTRWQSFEGTIGLPEINPAGYVEYRPTYLQLSSAGTITVLLGQGSTGNGPTRERYDLQAIQTILLAIASGRAQDDYAIRFLGTNASNTVTVNGTSVGIAMNPGEVSTVASATCEGSGALLALGTGVTFSGALTVDGAQALIECQVPTVTAQNGANVTVGGPATATFTTFSEKGSSSVTWLTGGTITTFNLQTGSVFDKSQNTQALTITNSNMDGDSTFFFDPWSTVTWTNATAIRNAVASGPVTFGPGKNLKIT